MKKKLSGTGSGKGSSKSVKIPLKETSKLKRVKTESEKGWQLEVM